MRKRNATSKGTNLQAAAQFSWLKTQAGILSQVLEVDTKMQTHRKYQQKSVKALFWDCYRKLLSRN